MAHYEGLKVEVISNGKSCLMYDDPDSDGHEDPFSNSSPPQKYIEAVTGATFTIVVTLDHDFQFKNCDAVRVKVHYDDTSVHYYHDLMPSLLSGKEVSASFKDIRKFCTQTNQWQVGDLTFGVLKIHDASEAVVSLDEIKGLGKIRVSWSRVRFGEEILKPVIGSKIISEVSEKVLKGKAIENTIKPLNLRTMQNTPSKQKQVITIPGDIGRDIFLNILYRSKRTLQMLGCIQPSPSPIRQESRPAEAATTSNDPQEELRALRARVAELEKRASNTPQPAVKPEQLDSKSRIKREREDTKNDIKPKRSRTSGRPEVVDLTDD